MTCSGAPNIFPIPIEGTFDDAQRVIKELFEDLAFKEEAALSAVNSINLARILAQSIYYLAAYRAAPERNREAMSASSSPPGTSETSSPAGSPAGWDSPPTS